MALQVLERDAFADVAALPAPHWKSDGLHTLRRPPRGASYSTGKDYAEGGGGGDGSAANAGAGDELWGVDGPTQPLANTVRAAAASAGMLVAVGTAVSVAVVILAAIRLWGDQYCSVHLDYYDRPNGYQIARVLVNMVQHAVFAFAPVTWLWLMLGPDMVSRLWRLNVPAAFVIGCANWLWRGAGLYADDTLLAWQLPTALFLVVVGAYNCYVVAQRVRAKLAPAADSGAAATAAASDTDGLGRITATLLSPILHIIVVNVLLLWLVLAVYSDPDASAGAKTAVVFLVPWFATAALASAQLVVQRIRYIHAGAQIAVLALLMAGNSFVVRILQAELQSFGEMVLVSLYLGAKEVLVRTLGRKLRFELLLRARRKKEGLAASRRPAPASAAVGGAAGSGGGGEDPLQRPGSAAAVKAATRVVRLAGWQVPAEERRDADIVVLGSIYEPVSIVLANAVVMFCSLAFPPEDNDHRRAAVVFGVFACVAQLGIEWLASGTCPRHRRAVAGPSNPHARTRARAREPRAPPSG